jgi:2-iminobutanoate/2-iminopropanoate deaminase
VSRRVVESATAPRPVGPYAQAVVTGELVFCAGQIGLDPSSGRLVSGGTVAELRQALANLAAVLAAADLLLDDVVKATLFLVDLSDGAAVNAAYGEVFTAPYPARSTVQVSALPAGARIEVEAIAARRV